MISCIMIGLVGVSALKFLETYIKRFNNLFFVFISTNIDDSPRKIVDCSSSCICGLIFGSCSYMYYMSLPGQLYKPLHGYVHLAVTTFSSNKIFRLITRRDLLAGIFFSCRDLWNIFWSWFRCLKHIPNFYIYIPTVLTALESISNESFKCEY